MFINGGNHIPSGYARCHTFVINNEKYLVTNQRTITRPNLFEILLAKALDGT